MKYLGLIAVSLASLAQPVLAAPAMTYGDAYESEQKAAQCLGLVWQVLGGPLGDQSWLDRRDGLDQYIASLEELAFGPVADPKDKFDKFVASQGPAFELGRMIGEAQLYARDRLSAAIGETPGMSQQAKYKAIAKIAMTQYDADNCDGVGK